MKKYLYNGPLSGNSLNIGSSDKPEVMEIMLHPGKPVDLPEEHDYTKTLLALGLVTLLDEEPTVAPASEPVTTKQKKEVANAS